MISDFQNIFYIETSIRISIIVQALFKQAMRHWENFTCIQFVERTTEHPNWIGKICIIVTEATLQIASHGHLVSS